MGTLKKQGAPYLHNDARGFYLCPHCGRTLQWPDDDSKSDRKGRKKAKKQTEDPFKHASNCSVRGAAPVPCAIIAKSGATTLRIFVDLPAEWKDTPSRYHEWGFSLGYALRTGMRQLYTLDGPEIEFSLEPMWRPGGSDQPRLRGALTFLDPAVGGSGFLDRAARELHLVAARTLEHLDHSGCESACYRCLKSYNNQRHHEHLNWTKILPDLEQLAGEAPSLTSREDYDPKPWLDAFAAGVGSPLELKFLRLFEARGVELDKQVPVAPSDGERPISVADFVVRGTKTAIYVDGAVFHRGDRLRRDRAIRRALIEGDFGWRVIEVTAGDLADPDGTVRRIAYYSSTEAPIQTRSRKAVAIAQVLRERAETTQGDPLTLEDAVAVALSLDGDQNDAFLALERLVQNGVLNREFLDVTQDPPARLSWDEVLTRLGGRDGLAGEGWREGARTMVVQWAQRVRGSS